MSGGEIRAVTVVFGNGLPTELRVLTGTGESHVKPLDLEDCLFLAGRLLAAAGVIASGERGNE